MPTWEDLVASASPVLDDQPATDKQRAYMVVLVFSKKIPDELVDSILELFKREDLPKDRASEIIDLLVRQPSLMTRDVRDRQKTFTTEEITLKNQMSDVLTGRPWPTNVKLVPKSAVR